MRSVDWDTWTDSQKRKLLEDTHVYPEHPATVQCIETHSSWVFLTERYAYKVRKAIRYGKLNYTTLQRRFIDGMEEVKQNRRLASDLYYGMVPLTYSVTEGFQVEGSGELLEWMIKMRRLPAEQMLDYKICNHSWTSSDIESLVYKLAFFYTQQEGVLIDGQTYIDRLRAECEFNYRYLSTHPYGLSSDLLSGLCRAQLHCLSQYHEPLADRATKGHVIDAHGDLRPGHICIEAQHSVTIFDCLQFDPELRKMDSIDELSFLSLECERIGAPEIGPLLFSQYCNVTKDRPLEILPAFYKSYRSCTWARLALERTSELESDKWNKWIHRANEYLQLADQYSRFLDSFLKRKEDLQLIH